MAVETTDFLVVGAGIIGLSIARELRRRNASARITVIEKERTVAMHASGKNSGVLHAGFYYSPDSLKARFTRIGNERLTNYCLERKLPIRQCGKLVVATRESELPQLDELYRRGIANGVRIEMIDAAAAREIEPRARVHERAIWSPTTSTVDPRTVMDALVRDADAERIDVQRSTRFVRYSGGTTRTTSGTIDAGRIVNAAGLEAASIARQFGFAEHYRILPFKGLYLYSDEPPGSLRTHVYPVPDPRFPFLGVHFTVTVEGTTKIGPTAAPAAGAFGSVLLMLGDAALRRHAIDEIGKSTRRGLVRRAAALLDGISVSQYRHWGTPGIRAQLYDTRRHALENDFVVEGDERSTHVLNAVSPGFTAAFSFAEHVVEQMDG